MRYYIGYLITVGLLIILILILMFGGGGSKNVPSVGKPLISFANASSEVRFTIDGPINAASLHQTVQITVSQNTVTLAEFHGYDGNVVSTQQYNNSLNGYNVFLHALNIAGFTEGNSSSSLSDERGICPLGSRYIYELIQNGSDLERFWSTSCGSGAQGTYNGNVPLTQILFKAQVPNYNSVAQGTPS